MGLGKSIGMLAAASVLAGALPTAAMAHEHERHGWHRDRDDGDDEDYRDNGYYHRSPAYYAPRAYTRPYRCRTSGTTGLIIGGAAGALLGREIARDRTVGALLGGGLGALAGRELSRKNRC